MSELNVNINDYLDEDEKEEICRTAFHNAVNRKIQQDLERILTNACYNVVFDMVDEHLLGDDEGKSNKEFIKEKVKEVLRGISSFHLFRSKGEFMRSENSPAQDFLEEAVYKNKNMIDELVAQNIKENGHQYVMDNLIGVMENVVHERLTGGHDE